MNPPPSQIPPDVTDVHDQIAALRAKVEELMDDQIMPAVVTVADRAEKFAHRATDQLDRLSACIRQRPLTSVSLGVAAGYVLAAVVRR